MELLLQATVLLALLKSALALYENGSVTAPCDSPLYCQGDILRKIQLAQPFSDSKTFVDMPTTRPLDEVVAAFNEIFGNMDTLQNNTELNDFLETYFGMAGTELQDPEEPLETDPQFLDNVANDSVAAFIRQVVDYWVPLTREYNASSLCDGCVNSFVPVNRTFVVAGGRFREPYYWDSYWIILGLLRTKGSYTRIALNIIENFLDFVEQFGFVPNGARVYYLNRSQPPLLTQMVQAYVDYTKDYTILERALPLLEEEHRFWTNNRTVTVEKGGQSYQLNLYDVSNNQPRPESYREDYVTATNESYYSESGIIYPEVKELNASERATLYSNLASGAESGIDYSSRWLTNPTDASRDVYFPLRSLNTREIVNVDLNSILYMNEMSIASFHKRAGNDSACSAWTKTAQDRSEAMYAVMWNDEYHRYFDWNLTSNAQNIYINSGDETEGVDTCADTPRGKDVFFSIFQLYPFWTGAAPQFLKSNPLAVRTAFEPVAELLRSNDGAVATTIFESGQQWDKPNVWPPLQYVLIKGLLNTPATFGEADASYQWTQELALNISQRYFDSTFCTWRSTGGSLPGIPQLSGLPDEANGTMFEKYNDTSINAVGGGGEYETVTGFGWTNGVLIWIGDVFGQQLQLTDCGNLTAASAESPSRKRSLSAVQIPRSDARWIAGLK